MNTIQARETTNPIEPVEPKRKNTSRHKNPGCCGVAVYCWGCWWRCSSSLWRVPAIKHLPAPATLGAFRLSVRWWMWEATNCISTVRAQAHPR